MEIPYKKIGLVVPCYNVEAYIDLCLDSIAAQTYQDFICILVNDGSTDGTEEHMRAYCTQYPAVFLAVTQENGGLSAARNTGLALLRGRCEYVTFADSDDYLSPDYLSALAESAEKYGSDIVWGFHSLFREKNGEREITEIEGSCRSHPMLQSSPVTDIRAFTEEILCDRIQSYSWAKLYRLSLFEGLEFPVGRIYEDVATTYRLAFRARVISAVEPVRSIYFYRVNPNGIVSTKTYALAWQIYVTNREQLAFCFENKLGCTEYVRAVMLSNALACVHCEMRGSDVPADISAQAKDAIRHLKLREIFMLQLPKQRKALLLLARMNLGLYMKLMKKFV